MEIFQINIDALRMTDKNFKGVLGSAPKLI